MIVLHDNTNKDEPIDECDLRTVGLQLLQLVYAYRDEIVISNDTVEDQLNKLEYIGKLITNKQYDQIINDPTIINLITPDIQNNDYLNMNR